jgi:tetratricopeptide (TPR) repeat protein
MHAHVRRSAIALALALGTSTASAQTLAPKRTLALPPPGCPRTVEAPDARRDVAESRRLAAQGREAALVGDRAGAREAFRKAAALDPQDERLAYALGRADEELSDAPAATAAYCRYLALAPTGPDADDVRQRIVRLAPPGTVETARHAQESFRAGVAALDASQWAQAVAAFDATLRAVPNAPEALYDRALAQLRLGRPTDAQRDFEAYLTTPQAADDRALVLRTIDAIRRPTYAPGTAFTRGLLFPGLGQFYTDRPALGIVALGLTAGSFGAAFYQETVVRTQTFTDPFGNPYTQPVAETEHPYAIPGIAVGTTVWLLAALEARHHADASSRSAPRLQFAPLRTGFRARFSF